MSARTPAFWFKAYVKSQSSFVMLTDPEKLRTPLALSVEVVDQIIAARATINGSRARSADRKFGELAFLASISITILLLLVCGWPLLSAFIHFLSGIFKFGASL